MVDSRLRRNDRETGMSECRFRAVIDSLGWWYRAWVMAKEVYLSTTDELKEETSCHKTALSIQKNFAKEELSEASIFLFGNKDKYIKYINAEEEHDYIFVHKLKVSAYGDEGNKHDFVILRKNKEFYLLQSMVGIFTLNQWINGGYQTIDESEKNLQNQRICIHYIARSQEKASFTFI